MGQNRGINWDMSIFTLNILFILEKMLVLMVKSALVLQASITNTYVISWNKCVHASN